MIEELKELVALLNSLPQLALWVAIGFWAYKVLIIGSIYGVIRFVVSKAAEVWKIHRNPPPVKVEIEAVLDGMTITNCIDELKHQIRRLVGKRSRSDAYIHRQDIDWLREAIDEKIAKEQQGERNK